MEPTSPILNASCIKGMNNIFVRTVSTVCQTEKTPFLIIDSNRRVNYDAATRRRAGTLMLML